MSKTKKPTPDELKSRFYALMSVTDRLPEGLPTVALLRSAQEMHNEIVSKGAADTSLEEAARFYDKNGAYVKEKGDGIHWSISYKPFKAAEKKRGEPDFSR